MYKQKWYIHSIEYYTSIRRDELSRHKKTWRKLKCILKSERSKSRMATYNANYITFWKRQNYRDNKKISGCRGRWGEDAYIGAQGIFKAVKLFCMMLYQYIHDIMHLTNPCTCTTQSECKLWTFINNNVSIVTNVPYQCKM